MSRFDPAKFPGITFWDNRTEIHRQHLRSLFLDAVEDIGTEGMLKILDGLFTEWSQRCGIDTEAAVTVSYSRKPPKPDKNFTV